MLSFHRKVVYPSDTDIADFDLNTDVEEYNYDGRLVFRGNLDPVYSDDEFQVYWLYDESNQRVGLAEHHGENHTCYWIRDNVYSTLFQEDGWTCRDRTLWNIMAPSAYEDCMRNGWTTVDSLRSRTSLTIVRPQDVLVYEPPDALCIRCGGGGGEKGHAGCQMEKHEPRYDVFFTLFVDDDGLIYIPPADTRAYGAALPTLRRPLAAGLDDSAISTIVGVGVGAGAGAGAGAETGASSSSPSSSSSSLSEPSAALAPPATGTGASPSSSSSLNISRAV